MSRLDAATRKKTATVVVNGKPKFPINDKSHAVQALREINSAKPSLTSSQKASVRRRAASFGAGKSDKKK